ncbi:zinc-binding alcohol dehydrogenase family protein [Dyadobacter sp. CY107]|uniref:zinc-binding alcohol dehydrogenase family protein n=1 Tax=Dyadobacter fanqingshengii TaxID=2906443 RepID=UPI001F1F2A72|nr:zinc-binding alcohol dehydrogenase family protein [Dyadobacter fanqingshengii]MCF2502041.1 zinc-binding alcohol dehydrogenase family protein [Dyadobacter fanqingshengii]
MKAAVIYTPGGPEQLTVEDRPVPQAGIDQVLVKVMAFGLNRSELMTRKGYSPGVVFPRILGIECVGEIASDPSGKWLPGQQVAACMGGMGRDYDGSYAEYAVLPSSIIFPFTSKLSWDILGAIPEMFQTVYGSLHLALRIQKGQTLLIRGGTSSIGLLAIQLASHAGLSVIATSRSENKKQFLIDKGADAVLIDDGNLKAQVDEFYPARVDKVLELVGANTLKDSLSCAKPGGCVCMTGMLSEIWSIKDFAPMEYIPAAVNLTVYDTGQMKVEQDAFQSFILMVERGEIQLSMGGVFKLDQIVKAHELMDSDKASGKIVVTN